MDNDERRRIRENLDVINRNVEDAARKSGRSVGDVRIVAVTKTFPAETVMAAYGLGLREFGENRVQEWGEKAVGVPSDAKWHLIGHLQTNKAAKVVGKVEMIQSLDSSRLAAAIDAAAKSLSVVQRCLIEVNIADEPSKFGLSPANAAAFAEELSVFGNIMVEGLMCVAPNVEKAEKNRRWFAKMYELSVDIKNRLVDNRLTDNRLVNNIRMDWLSMGMTGDYAVATEEGANIIRVGTGLFGGR